jgi:GDP-D-mannose dehydratase
VVPMQVREFVEKSFKAVDMKIEWEGEGVDEVGKVDGKVVVRVDPKYFRPTEVDLLLGDPAKIKEKLGWKMKCSFEVAIFFYFFFPVHTHNYTSIFIYIIYICMYIVRYI